MGRSPCCSKVGLNRGAWTVLEDKILTDYIKNHGEGKWRSIPKEAGLKRCGKSCRLRWLNYLRPDIKRGNISHDEEDLIIRLHKLLGNRWALIAGRLPGRTDNEIKNYWNTNLAKKAQGNQSNKSKNKKKPMIKESVVNVIKSKASKCYGTVVLNQYQPMAEPATNCNTEVANVAPPMVKNVTEESENSDGSLSFELTDEILSDFTMDFDMGDICLSEFLNSDFTNVTQIGGTIDQAILVSEKMVENWRESDHVLQLGGDQDFRSLASFSESAGDWIGNENLTIFH